jgi:hypothetical protein
MLRAITLQRILLVSLLTLLNADPIPRLSGGINVWTSHRPEGGRIRTLAIDRVTPTTLYAGTSGGGVFKSTNGGEN